MPGHVVCVYPSENPDCCPVHYFKEYVSKLPESQKCPRLYLAVGTAKQICNDQWYKDVPMGINNIGTHIKTICKEAGLKGFYTNHSLQASNVTNLYNSGVAEQIIQENTGHRLIEALCGYKVTSVEQKKNASKALCMQKLSLTDREPTTDQVQKVQLKISVVLKQ